MDTLYPVAIPVKFGVFCYDDGSEEERKWGGEEIGKGGRGEVL